MSPRLVSCVALRPPFKISKAASARTPAPLLPRPFSKLSKAISPRSPARSISSPPSSPSALPFPPLGLLLSRSPGERTANFRVLCAVPHPPPPRRSVVLPRRTSRALARETHPSDASNVEPSSPEPPPPSSPSFGRQDAMTKLPCRTSAASSLLSAVASQSCCARTQRLRAGLYGDNYVAVEVGGHDVGGGGDARREARVPD